MTRVLVTGAGGFVGARVLHQLADRYMLVPLPGGLAAEGDEQKILCAVEQAEPDVILHLAALSDTGYCQQHPEESYRANVVLPQIMARAAEKSGAKLVAFSSDQVYAGLTGNGPFAEDAARTPANVYGCHKLEMEQRVLDKAPTAVLLRATWLYDLPGDGLPIRGNLPVNLLQAAQNGDILTFSQKEYRGVTYVRELVQNLPAAMELAGGVYNFGSENDLNMWQTAHRFCEALHITPSLQCAEHVRSLAMDTGKLRKAGVAFCTTAEGIRCCAREHNIS